MTIDYNKIFLEALSKNEDEEKWLNSAYGKIKTISNTKVGQVGQDFIVLLCNELKISCNLPLNKKGICMKQNPWDVEIFDIKFELKTATEDTNKHFQFNHIRYHRKYDALLCLGVTPNNLFFGVWTKAEVSTGKAGNLVSMEKRANASYKLTKKSSDLQPIKDFSQTLQYFSDKYQKQSP